MLQILTLFYAPKVSMYYNVANIVENVFKEFVGAGSEWRSQANNEENTKSTRNENENP